jgi:hypothetical protein
MGELFWMQKFLLGTWQSVGGKQCCLKMVESFLKQLASRLVRF